MGQVNKTQFSFYVLLLIFFILHVWFPKSICHNRAITDITHWLTLV